MANNEFDNKPQISDEDLAYYESMARIDSNNDEMDAIHDFEDEAVKSVYKPDPEPEGIEGIPHQLFESEEDKLSFKPEENKKSSPDLKTNNEEAPDDIDIDLSEEFNTTSSKQEALFELNSEQQKVVGEAGAYYGNKFAIGEGDSVEEFLDSKKMMDVINSSDAFSNEEKKEINDHILGLSEHRGHKNKLSMDKDSFNKVFGSTTKALDPSNKIENGKDEEGKEVDKNQKLDENGNPIRENENNLKPHASYVISSLYQAWISKENRQINNDKAKNIEPIKLQELDPQAQHTYFESMNKRMDYLKQQMIDYEENADLYKDRKEALKESKKDMTPEEYRLEEESLIELNKENNKRKMNIEEEMSNMSKKLEDISDFENEFSGDKIKTDADAKMAKKMKAESKSTRERIDGLDSMSDKLKDKKLLDEDVSSSFKESLKKASDSIKKVAQKISQSINKLLRIG
jgi:hypothetical protein